MIFFNLKLNDQKSIKAIFQLIALGKLRILSDLI